MELQPAQDSPPIGFSGRHAPLSGGDTLLLSPEALNRSRTVLRSLPGTPPRRGPARRFPPLSARRGPLPPRPPGSAHPQATATGKASEAAHGSCDRGEGAKRAKKGRGSRKHRVARERALAPCPHPPRAGSRAATPGRARRRGECPGKRRRCGG